MVAGKGMMIEPIHRLQMRRLQWMVRRLPNCRCPWTCARTGDCWPSRRQYFRVPGVGNVLFERDNARVWVPEIGSIRPDSFRMKSRTGGRLNICHVIVLQRISCQIKRP